MAIDLESPSNFITTRLRQAVNWGRKYSLWPLPFGVACFAIEFIVHILDDFLIMDSCRDTCLGHVDVFLNVCNDIGIHMAIDKTFRPSTVMTFVGYEKDTNRKIRLPAAKLNARLL